MKPFEKIGGESVKNWILIILLSMTLFSAYGYAEAEEKGKPWKGTVSARKTAAAFAHRSKGPDRPVRGWRGPCPFWGGRPGMFVERKSRARKSKGGAGPWGSGNGRRRPCLSAAKRKCRRRDRAGAEECPGATPAHLILRGGWSGIPPWGDAGGTRENARGVTAIRQ